MKKLLLVLALIAGNCLADTVATMKNKSGGTIVLTDIKCKTQGLVAYSTNPNSNTALGCWFVDDNYVHIDWQPVGLISYEINVWTMANKPKRYD
jgi:hypothetical protein